MNDNINLNGSVVVLSHHRLVCKTSCTYSKTDVREQWSSCVAGNSPDCEHCARVGLWKRQLYSKGRESSVLDVNVDHIHCTNNQHKKQKRHRSVSNNIQSDFFFYSFDYRYGAVFNFYRYLEKELSLFTIGQKNNCYRSTILLSGLGWTIAFLNRLHNRPGRFLYSAAVTGKEISYDR